MGRWVAAGAVGGNGSAGAAVGLPASGIPGRTWRGREERRLGGCLRALRRRFCGDAVKEAVWGRPVALQGRWKPPGARAKAT